MATEGQLLACGEVGLSTLCAAVYVHVTLCAKWCHSHICGFPRCFVWS